jgi:N-methylhydantoinase B
VKFMTSDTFSLEKQRLAIKKIITSAVNTLNQNIEVHGAILDSKGDLIEAVGPNPLHYTGIEATVKAARTYLVPKNGETLITNDPYSGNTRLCDLLLIQGVFGRQQANELRYYIAVQLSIPQLLNKGSQALSTSVEEEGFRIPPTPLEQNGVVNPEILNYLGQSKINTESLLTLLEKVRSTLKIAAQDFALLETKMGRDVFTRGLDDLRKYSEKMMRKALHEIPDGEYSATEFIESDGFGNKNLRIQCKLLVQGENILVSFLGTTKQTKGPYNCNYTTTLGACYWFFRSLNKRDIPNNAGAFKAFSVEAPDGTLVNAKYPAPLLGGYYETSMRIIDALNIILNKALPTEYPAQSGGSSSISVFKFNDVVFEDRLGIGGGATKNRNGPSAIFNELQNYAPLSVEEIEENFPIQVLHSSPRFSSGGDGRFQGGDGLSRAYKFLADGQVALLSDRRVNKPRGLFGGGSGMANEINFTPHDGEKKTLSEKVVLKISSGDSININTPGGGGWGKKEEPEATS